MVEKAAKRNEKDSKTASRHEIASMMHMCSGLVGPKSGNVEKPLVFKSFLKGQEGHGPPRKNNNRVGRSSFWSKKLQKRMKMRAKQPLDMRWQV